MAKTATTRRAREAIVLTKSAQLTVDELATQIWSDLFKPVEGDVEKSAAAHKRASDQIQKLTQALRTLRDNSKPVQRQRLETSDVVDMAIGKSMSELQASYVSLDIAPGISERYNIPQLRKMVENDSHPLYNVATNFLKAHKVRFSERKTPSGRKVTEFVSA